MISRDRLAERGSPGSISASDGNSLDNDDMGQATQCVRKFAPNGRKKMRRRDNGHITACKISDANPNEMIASWSGDHIYSFDLIRSPDARDQQDEEGMRENERKQRMATESKDRKRKRKKAGSAVSAEGATRGTSRPRRAREEAGDAGDLALRVRYENGQSEDIAMNDPIMTQNASLEEARESMLSESQKRSMQIAKSMVKIRKLMFSLDASIRSPNRGSDPTLRQPRFTSALGHAAAVLPEMDEIIRSWRYPLNPEEEDIVLQQTLRANRDSSRRFVQAAGSLSRILGGRLQTLSRSNPALELFKHISPAPQEGPHISPREIFSYDFLKAITLWLEGGKQALLQGFKRPPNQRNENPRFPIPEEADHSGIDDYLIPYLLRLARQSPILDVDTSRFETDERRKTFASESAAVLAFMSALKMPLEDLSRAIMPAAPASQEAPLDRNAATVPVVQDRTAAMNFWAFKVGRGVLMNAGEGINYQFVDTAFGGLGITGDDEGRVQEDVDLDEPEVLVEAVRLVRRSSSQDHEVQSQSQSTLVNSVPGQTGEHSQPPQSDGDGDIKLNGNSTPSRSTREPTIQVEEAEADSDSEMILAEDLQQEIFEQLDAGDEDAAPGQDDDNVDEDSEDDEDSELAAEERQFMFNSAAGRGKLRESVESHVPCYTHSREYRGHCNVRTVKDCNFFGLQDEYVVSGSDSGHLFIWVRSSLAENCNCTHSYNVG